MVRNLLAVRETRVWSLGGKIPWRREWQPTPVFLSGKFHGQRSLAGYIVYGVTKSWTRMSDFHFHALEKEMATHSSVLAWRIPWTDKPGGLPSMGSHRVGHDWSDLAAAQQGLVAYQAINGADCITKCRKISSTSSWLLADSVDVLLPQKPVFQISLNTRGSFSFFLQSDTFRRSL